MGHVSVAALLGFSLLAGEVRAGPVAVRGVGVAFTARTNVGMTIEGATSALAVDEDEKNVTLVVALESVTTGVELRDRHMKERYLETSKFPEARLVIEKSCLALPEAGARSARCPGALTLHGHTKAVTVDFKATVAGATTQIEASFAANFVDHGVEEPRYAGIKVKPAVEVTAKFSASR